jgi:non-ribosomal peptide synthetase component F
LYSAARNAKPSPLPAAASFTEYVRNQTAQEQHDDRAGDEEFWLNQLSGELPLLELPTDRPRPTARTFNGARESYSFSPALSRSLRKLSARQGSTLFATMLAAFYTLLHRLTGQDDLVVGIPTAGRAFPGGDALVGHCINFLPLRVRFSGESRFTEHLDVVKQSFFSALDHRHCTYGRLIRKLNLPRDPNRMPLVSATFTLDRAREGLRVLGLDADGVPNPRVFSNFDLSFGVLETDRVLRLDCRYSTDLFDASTIQRWLAHFETLLGGIVADPAQPLSRLPLLTDAERRQVLVEWNDTHADYPKDACIHHLFQQQAARSPAALALVFDQQSLT